MTPLKPVAQWTTYEEARQAVQADLPRDFETNRLLVEEHQHWQKGRLWPGHRTGDPVVDAMMLRKIEPQFVADDVVGELVENRTNGLIGQEADIQLEPLDPPEDESGQAALAEEAENLLADLARWWDRTRFWERVADAADRVSYAQRGGLRLFVADGNLATTPATASDPATTRLPTVTTFADALAKIDLDAPRPDLAVRYVDPTTQQPAAIILSKTAANADRAEVWTVNAAGQTEARVFVAGGTAPPPLPIDLGGRLPFGEMRGKRLITEPMRRTQSLLNFIMTVTGRTVETAGFRERHVTNAEPQLEWLTQAPVTAEVVKTKKNPAGVDVLWGVRVPPRFGAGMLSEWQGLEIPQLDSQGREVQTVATPGVTTFDPVDPAFATDAAEAVRKVMYQRGKQGHLAIDSSVQASGTAYQQARAQHEADLRRLKGPCEGMIRDVLEAVLALAGQMAPEAAGILDRFRLVVNLRISAGPITTEDATTAVTLRDKGAISTQTMQARVGVEDPAAEQSAIDADPEVTARRWTAIAAAMTALQALPDATLDGAALLLGVTPEQVEILRTGKLPEGAVGAPKLAVA